MKSQPSATSSDSSKKVAKKSTKNTIAKRKSPRNHKPPETGKKFSSQDSESDSTNTVTPPRLESEIILESESGIYEDRSTIFNGSTQCYSGCSYPSTETASEYLPDTESLASSVSSAPIRPKPRYCRNCRRLEGEVRKTEGLT